MKNRETKDFEPSEYIVEAQSLGALERWLEKDAEQANQYCIDCGEPGETVGHMGCQYPGRISE